MVFNFNKLSVLGNPLINFLEGNHLSLVKRLLYEKFDEKTPTSILRKNKFEYKNLPKFYLKNFFSNLLTKEFSFIVKVIWPNCTNFVFFETHMIVSTRPCVKKYYTRSKFLIFLLNYKHKKNLFLFL